MYIKLISFCTDDIFVNEKKKKYVPLLSTMFWGSFC